MTDGRIQTLSPELANQIAAGEVIERPASVVKELLENSLDAGAKNIYIDIEKGGSQLIRVRDDGHGIDREDLPLALQRHATSKIKKLADLQQIASLGFRGEALASICGVTKFTLSSATAACDNQGWQITAAGADYSEPKPIGHPPGTTITVADLFFNTPARRRFLRAEKTEFAHIEELVKRIALSRFDFALRLQQNNRKVLHAMPANDQAGRVRRVTSLCGSAFMRKAIEIDMHATGLRIWGWMSLPAYSRASADLQYFYINGRIIKDRLIQHALRQVYQEYIPSGRYPGYILYLQLDPKRVDVNVHPTKHEVRFQETRLIHDFIVHSLNNALQQASRSDDDLFSASETTMLMAAKANRLAESEPSNPYMPNSLTPTRDSHSNEYLRKSMAQHSLQQQPHSVPAAEVIVASPNQVNTIGIPLSLLHDKYLLVQSETGLIIINLQKAQQQLIYATIADNIATNKNHSQPLFMPVQIELSDEQIKHLTVIEKRLAHFGIEISHSGPQAIIVRQLTRGLPKINVKQLLAELLNALIKSASDEVILALLAKHGAKAAVIPRTNLEMENFLVALCQLEKKNKMETIRNCWREISIAELDSELA